MEILSFAYGIKWLVGALIVFGITAIAIVGGDS
jgi:hypothetical protein